jgi:outer membrane protein OmpA-like peptidoglycan-associated protein
VDQTVRVNGNFSHNAELVNRIRVEVTEVEENRGHMQIDYQHNVKSESGTDVYEYGQVYESEYWRDARGEYDIEDDYYVPVVRDVPVFPDRELEVGETWTHTGYEVHDLRRDYGISDPFRFPIPVNYEYLGMRSLDGKEYPAISIQYNIFYQPDKQYNVSRYPVMISGFSNQTMYWSTEYGRPHAYEEEYLIVLNLSDGMQVEFEGTADAEVVEVTRLNRDQVAEEVERDLKENNVENATVTSDERGVTITLDNIQFPPDSDRLRESEKEKLDQITGILSKYPERDILITGHTALAGTEEGRQRLSEERAAAVGSYLIEQGVRNPGRLFYQGMGARDPVADNSTEEGMRKNRRVEFTILEN